MSPAEVAIIAVGWGIAIVLAGMGIGLVMFRTAKPKHQHTWSKWEVKEYRGRPGVLWGNDNRTILIREQERRCTDCGYTQTQELP